ncbi:hypothetical protein [Moorena sp. SIO3A2]|uniref:hypothetical protein n=1 Tax=Moorena sp. SIO3A2 TaxID=2607841 RepID=UPI0013BA384D|nr:hypothetical protein [Moorena sp. SIO3A2]NER90399.1 hypothetical protein [Moorena sp. SIO3A2]
MTKTNLSQIFNSRNVLAFSIWVEAQIETTKNTIQYIDGLSPRKQKEYSETRWKNSKELKYYRSLLPEISNYDPDNLKKTEPGEGFLKWWEERQLRLKRLSR